ncbi:MAG: hypothetical protein VB111_03455 [Clostridiaceae bacterium]|nr:hypothetical protein [Clostridiaceae bacterium]
MKKLAFLFLAAVMVITLAACTGGNGSSTATTTTAVTTTTAATTTTTAATTATTTEATTTQAATTAPEENESASLESIMESILEGVETPKAETVPVEDDLWENYVFIAKPEGAEAVVSESLIGSIAHSVVLIRVADAADAEKVAADIEDKANPRKWICVEAEKVVVTYHDDVILLCMSFEDTCDAIVENFDAIWK